LFVITQRGEKLLGQDNKQKQGTPKLIVTGEKTSERRAHGITLPENKSTGLVEGNMSSTASEGVKERTR